MANNYIEWNGEQVHTIEFNGVVQQHIDFNDVRVYDAVQTPTLASITASPSSPLDNQPVTLTLNGVDWNGETNEDAKHYLWAGQGIVTPDHLHDSTLELGHLPVGHYHYTCALQNSAGTSAPVRVVDFVVANHIVTPSLASITSSPASAYEHALFTLTANGVNWGGEDVAAKKTYQWTGSGITPASHVHDASVTPTVQALGSHHYTCFVKNSVGHSTPTRVVDVVVSSIHPAIPASKEINRGENVNIHVTHATLSSPHYTWYRNGTALSGHNSATLSYVENSLGLVTYKCKVASGSDAGGWSMSGDCAVNVYTATMIVGAKGIERGFCDVGGNIWPLEDGFGEYQPRETGITANYNVVGLYTVDSTMDDWFALIIEDTASASHPQAYVPNNSTSFTTLKLYRGNVEFFSVNRTSMRYSRQTNHETGNQQGWWTLAPDGTHELPVLIEHEKIVVMLSSPINPDTGNLD